jgi:hypothetical protein
MFGNADGRVSNRNLEKSKNENKKEQKICEKSLPGRIGRFTKSFVQSSKTRKTQAVAVIYPVTCISHDLI